MIIYSQFEIGEKKCCIVKPTGQLHSVSETKATECYGWLKMDSLFFFLFWANSHIVLWSATDYTVVFMAMYYITFINPKCIQQDNLSYTTIMPYHSPAICIRLYEKPFNRDVLPAWPGFLRLERFMLHVMTWHDLRFITWLACYEPVQPEEAWSHGWNVAVERFFIKTNAFGRTMVWHNCCIT